MLVNVLGAAEVVSGREGGGGGIEKGWEQTGSSSRWSGRDILRRKYCANRTGCDHTCSLCCLGGGFTSASLNHIEGVLEAGGAHPRENTLAVFRFSW